MKKNEYIEFADEEEKMKDNYYCVSKKTGVCYNCKFAYTVSQICLTCNNEKTWEKPTSVEPTGTCRYFQNKRGDEND